MPFVRPALLALAVRLAAGLAALAATVLLPSVAAGQAEPTLIEPRRLVYHKSIVWELPSAPNHVKWHRALLKAEAALRDGNDGVAAAGASRVARKIVDDAWYDARAARLLAESALIRAVAAARDGDQARARWLYTVAVLTDPEVENRPLDGYGPQVMALTETPRRRAGRLPPQVEAEDAYDPRVKRPAFADAPSFRFPRFGEGQEVPPPVVVEVLVDAEGRVSDPAVRSASNPIARYHVLDVLGSEAIVPAERGGKPVPALWELRVDVYTGRW